MKITSIAREAIRLLFILMLAVSYSCNSDGPTDILDHTFWYLTGYEDSERLLRV